MAGNIDQIQQQQGAQLSQQFLADDQKRKQQKGSEKIILENFVFSYLFKEHYDLIKTFSGSLIEAMNWSQITAVPGIANHMKIQTSPWKDGTFVAKKDLSSTADSLKQSQTKEDLALSEKQKNDQSKHEQDDINHKSFQQHNQDQQQSPQQSQQQGQQNNDDSNKNYWRDIQMKANQERMNITNKNGDDFSAVEYFLHEQSRILQSFKEQSQLISHINDERIQRSRSH